MHNFILADSESALWCTINPVTGLLDKDHRTPELEHTRLVQIAINGENPTVFDLYTEEGRNGFQGFLRWYTDHEDFRVVFHGARYDLPRLAKLGWNIKLWDCTLSMSLICSNGLGLRHSLDEVIARYTGKRPYDEIELDGIENIERKKSILQMSNWAAPELSEAQMIYAATDVGPDYRDTYLALWKLIQRPWFWRSYELDLDIQPVVTQLVENGLRLHLPKWKAYIAQKEAELVEIDAWMVDFIDYHTQRLMPEKFMVTLRRKKPREGKPAKVLKDGTVKTLEVLAQTVGDLAAIQPKPEWTPIKTVHPFVTEMEAGDYRVGYLVREEMGLEHGDKFNATSPQQMRAFVNTLLGIDSEELTFNDQVVEEIKRVSVERRRPEVTEFLEKHSAAQILRKLTSTYGESFWRFADSEGYIHSNIKTLETDTARFSSSEPNLQNVPRNMTSDLVCCEADEAFISADYSAQELRIIMLIGKQLDWYNKVVNGLDFHSMTASILSGKRYEELVNLGVEGKRDKVKAEYDELRTEAKAGSFAPVFGAGPRRMADIFKCSYTKAKKFCDGYWKTYPALKIMQNAQYDQMLEHGFVTDIGFGRVRFFNPGFEGAAQLEAGVSREEVFGKYRNAVYNYSAQSLGATILRYALRDLRPWLLANEHMRPRLRMTVHDSIKMTCLREYATEAGDALRTIMERAAEKVIPGITIPVDVDVHLTEKSYPSFKEHHATQSH